MLEKNTGLISIYSEEVAYNSKNDFRHTYVRKYNKIGTGSLYIKASVIEKLGFKIDEKYSVSCILNEPHKIKLSKTKNIKSSKLLPSFRYGSEDVYLFIFRTAATYISAQQLPLTEISYEVLDDKIIFTVPDTVLCNRKYINTLRRGIDDSVEKNGLWFEALEGFSGSAAAAKLDAYRLNKSIKFTDTDDMLNLLRDNGYRINQLNERLFKINDESATLGDLITLAQKYQNDLVLCT